jgi:hypothetical protein
MQGPTRAAKWDVRSGEGHALLHLLNPGEIVNRV